MTDQLAKTEMVVLQGTPFCNMNCSYCDLSAESRAQRTRMPPGMIERVFRDIFANGWYAPKLSVVWHSGEPLTLPPDYYQQAIDLILRLRDELAPGQVTLEFDFQTNAVLISDAWIAFFKAHKHHMRLGISCDGPDSLHDAFRVNLGGRATHKKVSQAMQALSDKDIPFKVIAVVTDRTLEDPDGFFDFFAERSEQLSGFHFNILADAALAGQEGLTYSRADRDRYYDFYRHLLLRARTHTEAGGALRIQNFTQALARIIDPDADPVAQASRPLRTLNVDALGFVTTFYAGLERTAFAEYYEDINGLALGNIMRSSLQQMIETRKFRAMVADFTRSQTGCRAACDYYNTCSGGFELSQLAEHQRPDGGETTECAIIVKTLVDAILDDVSDQARSRLGVA